MVRAYGFAKGWFLRNNVSVFCMHEREILVTFIRATTIVLNRMYVINAKKRFCLKEGCIAMGTHIYERKKSFSQLYTWFVHFLLPNINYSAHAFGTVITVPMCMFRQCLKIKHRIATSIQLISTSSLCKNSSFVFFCQNWGKKLSKILLISVQNIVFFHKIEQKKKWQRKPKLVQLKNWNYYPN